VLCPIVSAGVAIHLANRAAVDFASPQTVLYGKAEYGLACDAASVLHQRFLSAESDALADAQDPTLARDTNESLTP
jgi:hypothetical protein